MVTQSKFNALTLTVFVPLFLTGCVFGENKQFFETRSLFSAGLTDVDPADPTGTATGTATSTGTGTGTWTGTTTGTATGTSTATATATPIHTAMDTQNFSAAVSGVKKIDFLFVVDNSGSMADNQAKLAAGFQTFANTFYRRTDLDICTLIITTDRYLGRTGSGNYSRERSIPCTKPAGSNSWTNAQTQNHINSVINSFTAAVDVGTHGSGTELAGKSLQSFLNDSGSNFFRTDAVANITFITDENNYFFSGQNQAESSNDLPALQNATIYNSSPIRADTRTGIKNILDGFFTSIRPNVGLSYSITTFLELTQPATSAPGVAMNLLPLTDLVARDSAKADIEGDASDYANVYQSISAGLVDRANAFHLTHDLYEPTYPSVQDLVVKLVSASGSSVTLSEGTDYTVTFPNDIALNQTIANATNPGDQISVTYRYQTP